MAIIKLEDGSAQLEVTAFNELYDASRTWIREGELLVVRGKASFDEYSGSMRVTAEEVFDLASARAASAKRLEIICSSNAPVRIQDLSEKLKPWCGGMCPVILHYSNLIARAPLRLGEAWHVSLPDLLMNDLRALPGVENVRIVYGND
jgi:DNA polymerase-3 subunit alpha